MKNALVILKSRTVWTGIALILVNGVPAIAEMIPANAKPIVDSILSLLAIYFRVSPKQKF